MRPVSSEYSFTVQCRVNINRAPGSHEIIAVFPKPSCLRTIKVQDFHHESVAILQPSHCPWRFHCFFHAMGLFPSYSRPIDPSTQLAGQKGRRKEIHRVARSNLVKVELQDDMFFPGPEWCWRITLRLFERVDDLNRGGWFCRLAIYELN